jgi:hypothetical protein
MLIGLNLIPDSHSLRYHSYQPGCTLNLAYEIPIPLVSIPVHRDVQLAISGSRVKTRIRPSSIKALGAVEGP